MKRLFMFIVLLMLTNVSFANGEGDGVKVISSSTSGSGAVAIAQSNGVNNSGNTSVSSSDLGRMVPNVMAPSLTTTLTETCMGSTSFGGSGSGFGFSFGTTWRDSACVRRLDARQLAAFNDMGTAREIMCASSIVREAAKRAGRPCVEDGGLPPYQLRKPALAPVAAVTVEDAAAVKVVNDVANSNQLVDDGSPIHQIETPTN